VTDATQLVVRLRAVLERLAASSDSQIPHLVQLGVAPSADELALEFDAVYPEVASRATEVDIPHPALESLVTLNETLLRMSAPGQSELWTTDAIVESQWWSAVRKQAAEVLVRLDA
jgi:hypothetical protein